MRTGLDGDHSRIPGAADSALLTVSLCLLNNTPKTSLKKHTTQSFHSGLPAVPGAHNTYISLSLPFLFPALTLKQAGTFETCNPQHARDTAGIFSMQTGLCPGTPDYN
eukprot:1153098-Pelagomonas_calceolata.AAC.6